MRGVGAQHASPWLWVVAYACLLAGSAALLFEYGGVGRADPEDDEENGETRTTKKTEEEEGFRSGSPGLDTSANVVGDYDSFRILTEGPERARLCAAKKDRRRATKELCTTLREEASNKQSPPPLRASRLCRVGDKYAVRPQETSVVAARAAEAAFSTDCVLRGDGATLREVAEAAEDAHDRAREEIERTDGGALMSRLVEYRNSEMLFLACHAPSVIKPKEDKVQHMA